MQIRNMPIFFQICTFEVNRCFLSLHVCFQKKRYEFITAQKFQGLPRSTSKIPFFLDDETMYGSIYRYLFCICSK